MHAKPRKKLLARIHRKHPVRFDVVAMLVYMVFVYVWSVGAHPLGRDYEALATQGDGWPSISRILFSTEISWFGDYAACYHVVNLILLYATMLCLYSFTNALLGGPSWMGILAAVYFMASPVHTESVLNLSGVSELAPAFLQLATLALYASYMTTLREGTWLRKSSWKLLLCLAVFSVCAHSFPDSACLILLLVMIEFLPRFRWRRNLFRLFPFLCVGGTPFLHWIASQQIGEISIMKTFGPLYFFVYPIGFLPKTVEQFHAYPGLPWVYAFLLALFAALILRKAACSVILFGIVAMILARAIQGNTPVDPYHLVGGGKLLFAHALGMVAVVGVFRRMIDHPKWQGPVVSITTLLCLIAFGLQIRSNLTWKEAGRMVQLFQTKANTMSAAQSGEAFAVAPDFQYYEGAPLSLSTSISFNTPFSRRIPHLSLGSLHWTGKDRKVEVESWSGNGGTIRISGAAPLDVIPRSTGLSRVGDILHTSDGSVALQSLDGKSLSLSIKSSGVQLPRHLLTLAAENALLTR